MKRKGRVMQWFKEESGYYWTTGWDIVRDYEGAPKSHPWRLRRLKEGKGLKLQAGHVGPERIVSAVCYTTLKQAKADAQAIENALVHMPG
jgi:hypothetical protein